MAEKSAQQARDTEHLARQGSAAIGGPFRMLERFADEMDRLFDDFGLARGWLAPQPGRRGMQPRLFADDMWWPAVEVSQRNHELVIRADLPGLKKDDVKVDITDDAITISGERKAEHQHEEGGLYRSERQYGSFSRVIALPEGTIADQAKATFNNGVLEITVPAPPEQVTRGRRLEISDASATRK